ncbi:MAG TPA: MG2 domain-containing protein [Vicinamibacterales bacterium]|jgi:hypothetical protein|nr:MG2 domain-containing protein [Vicinamibacterales bacterium]
MNNVLRFVMLRFVLGLSLPMLVVSPARAQPAPDGLTVVSAGPTGEVGDLAQANEIRVIFSEPMVVLGRIPQPVTAPFITIRPAIAGSFRWSGTTILIFTPDSQRKLPFATRYDVTVDTTATATSGRRLAAPYTFTFTTPTVKLLKADWYRKATRYDTPMVVVLRFNQPVRAADILAHTTLHFEPHAWAAPTLGPDAQARLKGNDPQSIVAFTAKVAAAARAAASNAPLTFAPASDWDKKRFPTSADLVVLETTSGVPTESWVRVEIDATVPAVEGRSVPEKPQSHRVEAERTFFADGFDCRAECDPDRRNPILLRDAIDIKTIQKFLSARDLTAPNQPIVAPVSDPKDKEWNFDTQYALSLEDAGFNRQPPAHTYAVRLDAGLESKADGQRLGYDWMGIVENWHERAFTSFGDGHGVWESGAGLLLPFYARNFKDVTQWAVPVARDQLMARVTALEPAFQALPPGDGLHRTLRTTIDKIESHGLDLARAVGPSKTGLVWAGIREGDPVASSKQSQRTREKSAIVQVTNLGLNVKDSPQNTLVFVTRLDDGRPVPGARVSLITADGKEQWNGLTGSDGAAIAPGSPRDPRKERDLEFIVVAEKDGDIAYLGSNWHEGIEPWEFGYEADLYEKTPILRGSIFTDRGVYRLGEEIHFKAILRSDTPEGIKLLPAGAGVDLSLHDSQDKEVDKRTIKVNEWSGAEWTFKLPGEGSLGTYRLDATMPDSVKPAEDWRRRRVIGTFLVAAYRRPDFRVDATLGSDSSLAGTTLSGVVTAKYLFGASMAKRTVKWRASRYPLCSAPAAIQEHFADARFVFAGDCGEGLGVQEVGGAETALGPDGQFHVGLKTKASEGRPYSYTFEGDVEDISRQHIAGRASFVVNPAPWYVGVMMPSYFIDQQKGLDSAIVAVSNEGAVAPGVTVHVTLKQVQWHSVRRAEGQGFYNWETTREEVAAGDWTVTTAGQPVPLLIPLQSGGYFEITAEAGDNQGHVTRTKSSFYSLGPGYTAWERFDHNRITLVPEKSTYKPGESARIMIQSPWERATALVTTEREGVRSHRQFDLTSSQEYVTVPVAEADIPNVFVSVLLVKGRTKDDTPDDGSDPGKPAFRLGYVELKVEDQTKRLSIAVTANKTEYRPANTAKIDLAVNDATGNPVTGEVTLWAVDYGVLSLTAYKTPDVLKSVYIEKALQVMNADNRQRLISRRALIPKGEDDGGGGGNEGGMDTSMRKDFRVLAFWLGSVVTDPAGRASLDVQLPESLTTYRIMAVAADKVSRFGSGETEIRINKPLTMKSAFPRFMAVGDTALFGSVVTSQLREPGTAIVTMRSLDPNVLEIRGSGRQTVEIAANGSLEVRFDAMARAVGPARVQMTARLGSESDAFEDVIPVEILSSPETVAAYGEARPGAKETVVMPAGVVPGFGGLHIELSSTAMVGLGEGARYLVEYPYGCAEQQGSRALALLLASDLGDAFRLPGIEPNNLRDTAQTTIRGLAKFQCANGGFSYWPGDCRFTSPYLTAYLLHVFQQAITLKYDVDPAMTERAYTYLQRSLSEPAPGDDGFWPAYTAWQTFAVKVLVEGGRNQDSNINRLYQRLDRMPVFAMAYLLDALVAKGESGQRVDELQRRITNSILPEGGSAHIEELSDPYLLWFWNSNIRSTSIALRSLMRGSSADTLVRPVVRWLLDARKNGRWGNTQENAWAMEALVAYYRKYESEIPDFRAVVKLANDDLIHQTFQGRSAVAAIRDVPMSTLAAKAAAGSKRELSFTREGTGTLFYTARLRYAADQLYQEGLDTGFHVERRYEPFVESGSQPPASLSYKAGDMIRVTLSFELTKERRFVAVTDPLPAGFEPVESWFATTAASLAQDEQKSEEQGNWRSWWQHGGFDHVERHDDHVQLFATRLSEGHHEFSYIVRATTPGTFRTAPAHAEEMYEPEVFGRTATSVVDVKR